MILLALKEYYDRKPELPRAGFEMKEIPFVLVLNPDGTPVSLNETYEGTGKGRRAKRFLVPQAVKRSSNVVANLLWDNPAYALGVDSEEQPESVAERHAAFRQRIENLGLGPDPGVAAVCSFLSKPDKTEALQVFGNSWEGLQRTGADLSFQLNGQSGLIVQQPSVQAAVINMVAKTEDDKCICLVTGEPQPVERLHAAIKGVWGAQSSGANIVAVNNKIQNGANVGETPAFSSFRKQQGYNSPVGKEAAFAYTTALNYLLGKDSKQRMQVGDASTIFWSQEPSALEDHIADFFGEPPKDDPDRNVRAVASLFQSVYTGAFSLGDSRTRFYVLGLAPNVSRIAVRFWIVDTVAGIAGKICQHFEDTRIVHGPRDQDTLSLFRLLISTATQGKSENILPNLGADVMRAILAGLPYPQTLLEAAIRRIRAEQSKKDKRTGKPVPSVTYERAALIKACLNRSTRSNKPKQKEELHVCLDLTNTNVGYQLGRLFATLERIQIRKFTQKSGKEPNSTIRDKYYGSASGTPVAVFGTLIRLSKHHLASLENTGERINFEKLLGEIMCGINDFPSHLQLDDQGRFAIGYYHQMQDFFSTRNGSNHRKEAEDE
jgi:CRISPR-associated protein Csd1